MGAAIFSTRSKEIQSIKEVGFESLAKMIEILLSFQMITTPLTPLQIMLLNVLRSLQKKISHTFCMYVTQLLTIHCMQNQRI